MTARPAREGCSTLARQARGASPCRPMDSKAQDRETDQHHRPDRRLRHGSGRAYAGVAGGRQRRAGTGIIVYHVRSAGQAGPVLPTSEAPVTRPLGVMEGGGGSPPPLAKSSPDRRRGYAIRYVV